MEKILKSISKKSKDQITRNKNFIRRVIVASIVVAVLLATTSFIYFSVNPVLPDSLISLLPEIRKPTKDDTIIIFSPHNDDETLGVGGYIQEAIRAESKVIIVFMTNGDGHRLTTVEEFRKLFPKGQDYINSGYERQKESKEALKTLGVSEENIIFLGYPDRGLEAIYRDHKTKNNPYFSLFTKENASPYTNSYEPGALYYGEGVKNNLVKILTTYRPIIIFSSDSDDQNSDHKATDKFIKWATSDALKPPEFKKPEIFDYMVHFSNYPGHLGFRPNYSLTPPLKLITSQRQWYIFELEDDKEKVKEQAILQYKSQFGNPLLKGLMQSFIRKNEVFSIDDIN